VAAAARDQQRGENNQDRLSLSCFHVPSSLAPEGAPIPPESRARNQSGAGVPPAPRSRKESLSPPHSLALIPLLFGFPGQAGPLPYFGTLTVG
jgi:hypothetical protein